MGEVTNITYRHLELQPYAALLFWTTNDLIDSRDQAVRDLSSTLIAQTHPIARICTSLPRALVILGGRAAQWNVDKIYDSFVSDLRAIFIAYGVACTDGEEICDTVTKFALVSKDG